MSLLPPILFLFVCPLFSASSQITGQQGVLDLQGWDYNGTLALDKGWEFYWNRLLEPGQFSPSVEKTREFFSFPSSWRKKGYTSSGYATYRLILKGLLPGVPLSVNCHYWGCAFRLWIGEYAYQEKGLVSRKPSEVRPASVLINDLRFVPESENLELVLQVAAREDHWSNKKGEFELGNPETIQKLNANELAIGLLLIGSLGIIGLYFLILFLLRRQEKSSLYFGLFSLHLCFILFFVNFTISSFFLPSSYFVIIRILQSITCTAAICFFEYIRTLYPEVFKLKQYKLYLALGIPFLLLMFFAPLDWIYLISAVFAFLIVCPLLLLLLFFLVRATISRKNLDAGLILAGSLTLILAFAWDIFFPQLKEIGFIVTPFGFIIFILFQALLLSRRFVKAFREVEILSGELEQKNTKLLAADKLKDEFLANTSHELRTPLHAIIGLTDSLIGGVTGKLKPDTVKNLKLISSSGKRLYNLVNDILDFSKLKNNELILNIRPVDIRPIIESVIFFSRQLAKGKNLAINTSLPDNLPLVAADENRLEQILFNLLGNAIKFTENGSIDITAAVSGTAVAISVQDTGKGIPEEKQDDIFNAFEQLDGSVIRDVEGTGLGLAITKKLVELQAGRIEVASIIGEGSCFTIYIPLSVQQTPAPGRENSAPHLNLEHQLVTKETKSLSGALQKDHNGRFHILVIDDDPVNIQVVENQLFSSDYFILSTTSGQEALDYLDNQPSVDLVLLDVMMPGISGYQLCRRIRETFSLYELPVLMLTARNQVMDIVEGFDSGTNDYLVKPFNRQEIRSRVRTLLNLKHLTRTNSNLESANLLKSRLMHIVAHDIKNPLASIKLNTSLISRKSAQQDSFAGISPFVQAIRRSSDKMDELVSEFLENERIQEGKCILEKTEFDLVELLEEVAERFGEAAEQKKQTLLLQSGQRTFFFKADRLRLEEILANLVSNAIKYSPLRKKIFLRLELTQNEVVLEVEDQGPGLTEEDLPRLFQPFQRLSARPTAEEPSTGLGLSITRGLVELHAGKICAVPRAGKGALFRVVIPF